MQQLIGLATFENRLASLLEKAGEVRIYEQKDNNIYPVGRFSLPQGNLQAKVSTLLSHGVKHLVCGAVSNCDQRYLAGAGIIVYPWIRGSVEDVLAAWKHNDLPRMAMPGCQKGCRNRGQGYGRGRRHYQSQQRRQS
jgi:predicted Fe-Mo cluster-binding NifX family protein